MKPHIKKVNGLWWCEKAKGLTPKLAYSNYRFGVRMGKMLKDWNWSPDGTPPVISLTKGA